MKIPSIFKNRPCSCGKIITEEEIEEVGVDVRKDVFVIRFRCSSCNLLGKVVFPERERDVVDLCYVIMKENDEIKKREETFDMEFCKNKMGCLFIPEWTDERFDDLCHSLGVEDFE